MHLLLAEAAAGPVRHDLLPEWLHTIQVGPFELWQALGLLLAAGVALVVGRLAQALVLKVGARIAKATSTAWDDSLLTSLDGPFGCSPRCSPAAPSSPPWRSRRRRSGSSTSWSTRSRWWPSSGSCSGW